MRALAVKSVSPSSVSSRYRSMVSMASMRSSVVAVGVGASCIHPLRSGDGSSMVAKTAAHSISGVAAVQHGAYPTTMPCKRRSAATSSGLALPVVIILAVQMFSQWFIRSAVKPRGSHSRTVASWARNSSSAVTRSCRAANSSAFGAAVGVDAVAMVSPIGGADDRL